MVRRIPRSWSRAAELGLTAIAITDCNSVAGVVRTYSALKELDRLRAEARTTSGNTHPIGPTVRSRRVTDHSSRQTMADNPHEAEPQIPPDLPLPKLIPGARIVLTDSAMDWLDLPTDVAAWSKLTRLLSLGKRRADKGQCFLLRKDLLQWGAGMILIALPPDPLEPSRKTNVSGDLRVRFETMCEIS